MNLSASINSEARATEAAAKAPRPAQDRSEAIFGGPVMVLQVRFANGRRFHGVQAEYLWCRHCTRAFPNGTYRQEGEVRRCPYAGCGGHSIVDAVAWSLVQGTNAGYPFTPQLGTKYVLDAAPRPRAEPSLLA